MASQTKTPSSNVDQAELKKFADLAHRWWDKNSEFKPLHDINPLRLDFIDQQSPLAGKAVLDIGCGGGILSESMAQRSAQVSAIDMGEKAINVAKLHQLESGVAVDYQVNSAEQMAQQHPQAFDVVTCMEMLEHVPNPSSVVQACASLVKPGGDVFFSTLNRNPKSYLFAVIGAEYVLRMLPKGTHEYAKFIKPSELAHWAQQAGLSLVQMKGMQYHPLRQQYSLGQDVSVNYLMHFRKLPA